MFRHAYQSVQGRVLLIPSDRDRGLIVSAVFPWARDSVK